MFLILLALFLVVLAAVALWVGSRWRQQSGLPPGRVIYVDTGGWNRVEKPLYDPRSNLTGKPDYLVEQDGALIPVEVKSGEAPLEPHAGHRLQLASYCLLVERTSGKRPPYGILRYRNRTFAIDYTAELEAELLAVLEQMRQAERQTEAARSHNSPARCTRCGYRSKCDQRL